jgi:hypothetical protein
MTYWNKEIRRRDGKSLDITEERLNKKYLKKELI